MKQDKRAIETVYVEKKTYTKDKLILLLLKSQLNYQITVLESKIKSLIW